MTRCNASVLAALLGLAVWGCPACLKGDSPRPTFGRYPADTKIGTVPEFLLGADWPTAEGNRADPAKEVFYQCGLNYARITGGGYGWATKMHRQAVEELQGHGVKVILQLGSHYPSADYFRFKDDYFVDESNHAGKEDRKVWAITYNGQAWPQYSYAAGDEFRGLMEKDFGSYLAAFKDLSNVRGVILHNEPGLFWLSDRVFDYNPKAIAQFRLWLKDRYGEIHALNAHWGGRYGDFAEVQPPRSRPPLEAAQIAAWMDWRRFQVELVGRWMDWEAAMAARVWGGLPRTTNLAGPMDNWAPYRCSDNFRLSRPMDFCGIDIYPSQWTKRSFAQYAMDMTAGVAAGRPIHVLECEAFGGGVWGKYSEAQRARLLRAEVWSMIGHGAKGILLWRLTGADPHWLTHGQMNDRCKVMRDIAAVAKKLELGKFHKAARRAALCVDDDPLFYLGAVESKPLSGTSTWSETAQGLYCAMSDAGYETDVVFAQQLRQGDWKKYKVIALAGSELMDDDLAKALAAFVHSGGTLVAAGPLATRDAWGRPFDKAPGLGLDRLFGLSSKPLAAQSNHRMQLRGGAVTAYAGAAVAVSPDEGTKVLATFADSQIAAVTEKSHAREGFTGGPGRAVLIAGSIGQPYIQGWGGDGARRLMETLLEPSLGRPEVRIRHDGDSPVDASILQDERGRKLLVLAQPLDQDKMPAKLTNLRVSISWPGKTLPDVAADLPWAGDEAALAKPATLDARTAGEGTVEFLLPELDGGAAVLLTPKAAR